MVGPDGRPLPPLGFVLPQTPGHFPGSSQITGHMHGMTGMENTAQVVRYTPPPVAFQGVAGQISGVGGQVTAGTQMPPQGLLMAPPGSVLSTVNTPPNAQFMSGVTGYAQGTQVPSMGSSTIPPMGFFMPPPAGTFPGSQVNGLYSPLQTQNPYLFSQWPQPFPVDGTGQPTQVRPVGTLDIPGQWSAPQLNVLMGPAGAAIAQGLAKSKPILVPGRGNDFILCFPSYLEQLPWEVEP